MKQEIIRDAMAIIQQRKREAEANYNTKMAPLFCDEEYIQAYKNYTRLQIENARKMAYGEKPDEKSEQQALDKIERLKDKHRLSGEKINYSCKKCNDEGYNNGQMCTCLKTEISKQILKNSGFEELKDFDNEIKTSGDLAPVYKKMQDWCNSDFKKNLIYIAGPTGVGKTYLIRCMANELIKRGKIIKMVSAPNMSIEFKEFTKYQDTEIIKKYIDCEILFIDDLGTETMFKNSTLENLYLVLNERKIRRLPTIITSNLSLSDLGAIYGERIYSRIVDRDTSITIYLNGQDKRINKK